MLRGQAPGGRLAELGGQAAGQGRKTVAAATVITSWGYREVGYLVESKILVNEQIYTIYKVNRLLMETCVNKMNNITSLSSVNLHTQNSGNLN